MRKRIYTIALLIGMLFTAVFVSEDAYAAPDGKWLTVSGIWWFKYSDGNYATNEYIDGCWMDNSGVYVAKWSGGTWNSDAIGWWYQANGWYPTNTWLKIDGSWYYFKADGYMAQKEWNGDYYLGEDGAMVTDTYVGRYYIDKDGKWDSQYDKEQWEVDLPEELVTNIKASKNENGEVSLNKLLECYGFTGTQSGMAKDKKVIKAITSETPKIIEIWDNDKYYKFDVKTSGDFKFGDYYLTKDDVLNIHNFIKTGDTSKFQVQKNPHKPTT